MCAHIVNTQTVTSTSTDFHVTIRGNLNCDNFNVVYMLECDICNQQYIGHTEKPFRTRFINYKPFKFIIHTPFKTLLNLPISKHLIMPGHSFDYIKATVLNAGFCSHHEREIRESLLIYKFGTLNSRINEHAGTLTFLLSTT